MTTLIGVLAQKGGVGKSSLSQLLAVEYVRQDWDVNLIDLDVSQASSRDWQVRREQNAVHPYILTSVTRDIGQALQIATRHEMAIFDAPPHSDQLTLEVARRAHLCLLPSGTSLADLRPQILLAKQLVDRGVPKSRIAIALMKATSESTASDARDAIIAADFAVLPTALPFKTAYERAGDEGKAFSEVPFATLRRLATQMVADIHATLLPTLEGNQPHEHTEKTA